MTRAGFDSPFAPLPDHGGCRMQHSPGQEYWRAVMDHRHRFGIPCLPINRSTHRKGATMARTITLPARANALTYGDAEVIDALIGLYLASDGEGVVIDDEQDTEPKARVRARSMVKQMDRESFAVSANELPEDYTIEQMDNTFDRDDDGNWIVFGTKPRTHTIKDGDKFLPVLSLKPQS